MKSLQMIVLILGICGSVLIPEIGNAFAQSANIEAFEFDTTQSITIILIGCGAGLLVSYQGYRTTTDDFDTLKFFDSVIKSILVSVPLAITSALTYTHLGIFEYVLIFGASMGFAWQIRKTMKPTLSSNEAKPI